MSNIKGRCCMWSITIVLIALQEQVAHSWNTVSFVSPLCHTTTSLRRHSTARFLSQDDDLQPGDGGEEEGAVVQEVEVAVEAFSPKPRSRQLDGLMAAVTRTTPRDANVPTTNLPFFGELPIDGSLVVLAPAAVIAVVGFVMSLVVAFNSKDAFVAQLTVLSDDINTAALAKTNRQAVDGSCRGLCSSQDEQLESMRIYMNSLAHRSE